jgi:hypothetical protein
MEQTLTARYASAQDGELVLSGMKVDILIGQIGQLGPAPRCVWFLATALAIRARAGWTKSV